MQQVQVESSLHKTISGAKRSAGSAVERFRRCGQEGSTSHSDPLQRNPSLTRRVRTPGQCHVTRLQLSDWLFGITDWIAAL